MVKRSVLNKSRTLPPLPDIDIRNYVPKVYLPLVYYATQQTSKYKEFILKGGRASLKSTVAVIVLILRVLFGYGSAVCIRRYKDNLRKSCRSTIITVIKRMHLERYFEWSEAPKGALEIRCTLNGSWIMFFGLDDPEKLRSFAEEYTVGTVWVEETQTIETMEKLDDMMATFDRGENEVIFLLSLNPKNSKRHFCNNELIQLLPHRFILHTTYLDVKEWIGTQAFERAEAMKIRNYEKYRNMYLGEIGVYSKGKVFNNVGTVTAEELQRVKASADYIYRGLDLGFSKTGDPTSYTGWVLKENSNGGLNLYCVFEHYEVGMKVKDLPNILKKHNKYNNLISSDHMPVVLDPLRDDYDINVEEAYKYNQREFGYYWLSTEVDNIYFCQEITPDAYREFDSYEYATTKDDQPDVSKYPKKDDHSIDSCRYALSEFIKERVELEKYEDYREETA